MGNDVREGEVNSKEKKPEESALSRAEFARVMEEIRKSNAGQEKYARRQYRMAQITTLASLLMLAAVCAVCLMIIPKVNTTYENMELIMENLKVITGQLAEVDMDEMVGDINSLVTTSEKNINSAMKKIDDIDIEGLNDAIHNLSDAVEPFAKLFGGGKR